MSTPGGTTQCAFARRLQPCLPTNARTSESFQRWFWAATVLRGSFFLPRRTADPSGHSWTRWGERAELVGPCPCIGDVAREHAVRRHHEDARPSAECEQRTV